MLKSPLSPNENRDFFDKLKKVAGYPATFSSLVYNLVL